MRGLSSRGLRLHRHRDDRRRDTGNESEHQGWEDRELRMTAPVSIVHLCRTNRVACHGDHASVESDVAQESPGTGRAMNTRHCRAVLAVRRGALRRCVTSGSAVRSDGSARRTHGVGSWRGQG